MRNATLNQQRKKVNLMELFRMNPIQLLLNKWTTQFHWTLVYLFPFYILHSLFYWNDKAKGKKIASSDSHLSAMQCSNNFFLDLIQQIVISSHFEEIASNNSLSITLTAFPLSEMKCQSCTYALFLIHSKDEVCMKYCHFIILEWGNIIQIQT